MDYIDKNTDKDNLQGKKFGSWTVIGPSKVINGYTHWYCRCECGTEKFVMARNLKNGNSTSCGNIKNYEEPIIGNIYNNRKVIKKLKYKTYLCQCQSCKEIVELRANSILKSKCKCTPKIRRALNNNLTGQKFGRWTVTDKRKYNDKTHEIFYWCICQCGTEKWVVSRNLLSGKSTGCPHCARKNKNVLNKSKLLYKGNKFGHLTVLGPYIIDTSHKYNYVKYLCRCDCGKEKYINATSLRCGKTTSCGSFKHRLNQTIKYRNLTIDSLQVLDERKRINNTFRYLCKCNICGIKKWVTIKQIKRYLQIGYKECTCKLIKNPEYIYKDEEN